jgi:hypothetical protein
VPGRGGGAGRRSRRGGPHRGRAGGGPREIRGGGADGVRRAAGIPGAEGLGAPGKRDGKPHFAVDFPGGRWGDIPLGGADESLAQVSEGVIKVCHCPGEAGLHRFGCIAGKVLDVPREPVSGADQRLDEVIPGLACAGKLRPRLLGGSQPLVQQMRQEYHGAVPGGITARLRPAARCAVSLPERMCQRRTRCADARTCPGYLLVRLTRPGVMARCRLTSRPVTAEPFGRGSQKPQDVREDVGDVERLPHGELTGPRSHCLVRGVCEVVQRPGQPGLLRLRAPARPAHRDPAPTGCDGAGSALLAGWPDRPRRRRCAVKAATPAARHRWRFADPGRDAIRPGRRCPAAGPCPLLRFIVCPRRRLLTWMPG